MRVQRYLCYSTCNKIPNPTLWAKVENIFFFVEIQVQTNFLIWVLFWVTRLTSTIHKTKIHSAFRASIKTKKNENRIKMKEQYGFKGSNESAQLSILHKNSCKKTSNQEKLTGSVALIERRVNLSRFVDYFPRIRIILSVSNNTKKPSRLLYRWDYIVAWKGITIIMIHTLSSLSRPPPSVDSLSLSLTHLSMRLTSL